MELYSKIIEQVNDIVFLLNEQGAFLSFSPRCSELFETECSQLKGGFFIEFIHSEDMGGYIRLLNRLQDNQKKKACMKCRLRQKNGIWACYFLNVSLLENSDENKRMFLISAYDAGYYKKAESMLMANEKRKVYRDFLENCMEAVVLFDLNTKKVIEANQSFLKLFGYHKNELVFLKLHQLVPEEYLKNTLNDMLSVKMAGDKRKVHAKWYKKNRELIDIELVFTLLVYNGKKMIHTNIRGITAAEEQRISVRMQELYKELIEKDSPIEIVRAVLKQTCSLFKAHGAICLLINEEKALLESICSVGIGREIEGIVISLDDEMMMKIRSSGSDWLDDLDGLWQENIFSKSGERISSAFGLSLRDIEGNVFGLIALTYLYRVDKKKIGNFKFLENYLYVTSLIIDNFRSNKLHRQKLSEEKSVVRLLKQNEDQMKQTQKMEALGTLAGGIAHDFNNILTGIIGYTELSLEDTPRESMMYQCLMESLKLSERAKNLVAQILSFSRKTVNLYQRVDIERELSETVGMLRAMFPSTVTIRENYCCSSEYLYADPSELQQLIMNLCINAEHAMREKGGTLMISTDLIENEAGKGKRFQHIKSGKYVKISIRDTGCGMDQRTMDRIFEPFFTTKGVYEGTGLGLSVVHGIVTRHKGAITVDSEVGKGSVFDIYLPIS